MTLALVVLSGFVTAMAAPWLHRVLRRVSGWMIALFPLGLTVYFSRHIGQIAAGEVLSVRVPWIPSLGISFSFYLDGLSLVFALLICGIGTLVVIYTGGYLSGNAHLGRFYLYLLGFLASMLGLVLADNALTLFVFWELTSVSSYLLIGFEHERAAARSAALQALLVTGLGGLAMLAGLLLLGQAGGSLELSQWLSKGDVIRAHALYLPALLLILAGAFTKSAQFPFHFWLPSAMEAPTPVSAYLHSATMVKAGVYLLARLSPVLGGTDAWFYLLVVVGATTLLVSAYLAFHHNDLKRMLAYSTVSALGMLTLLIGLGTEAAIQAAIVYLLAHALYKGALFLVAGAVDHEAGTRDVRRLGGLRHDMPLTAAAAMLAALSLAGLPPLFGFLAKEMLYEAVWHSPSLAVVLGGVVSLSSMLLFAVAGNIGIRPFFGAKAAARQQVQEAPLSLLAGPCVLAGLGLLAGLIPALASGSLVSPSVAAVLGRPSEVDLALFHGWNPILLLSMVTVVGGVGLYTVQGAIKRRTAPLADASGWGPARWYEGSLEGLNLVARLQTRLLQSGYLRYYLLTILATTIGLTGYTFWSRTGVPSPPSWESVPLSQAALVILIVLATFAAIRSRSRLGAVASLGVVGYSIALIFVLFGAPDLAMTQFLVETLTVILLVLILYHLPSFATLSSRRERIRDMLVALTAGGMMTVLVWAAISVQPFPSISSYFAQHSAVLAHGRNIVNVILVDFRGLDTLGEITVLAVAGVGVYSLLKLRLEKKGPS
ncbi:MAG: putative monovalent cation/H+ antiporter subunit A [Acidobacteria bacterium]|nr:putative monovalent cation/H+ antiporter subunit A [Acidobacteriota bacterium]